MTSGRYKTQTSKGVEVPETRGKEAIALIMQLAFVTSKHTASAIPLIQALDYFNTPSEVTRQHECGNNRLCLVQG
jgi:hypothetical protein